MTWCQYVLSPANVSTLNLANESDSPVTIKFEIESDSSNFRVTPDQITIDPFSSTSEVIVAFSGSIVARIVAARLIMRYEIENENSEASEENSQIVELRGNVVGEPVLQVDMSVGGWEGREIWINPSRLS